MGSGTRQKRSFGLRQKIKIEQGLRVEKKLTPIWPCCESYIVAGRASRDGVSVRRKRTEKRTGEWLVLKVRNTTTYKEAVRVYCAAFCV